VNAIAEIESPNIQTDAVTHFLAFKLNGQEFAIEVLRVQEIRNYSRVTLIPNTPQSVKGVMNLRGAVIKQICF